jgi:hypothetical protein
MNRGAYGEEMCLELCKKDHKIDSKKYPFTNSLEFLITEFYNLLINLT